jgi:hypothetical protein
VLIMNTAVLWYVIGKRFDEIQVSHRAQIELLLESVDDAKTDLYTINQNILKLDDNVVSM